MRKTNGNGADPTANGLTAQILEYLTLRGILAWRNNVGMFRPRDGTHAYRFGRKGSGDILGIMPPDGRFLSIEVKVGKDKPRDAQREWMADVVQHGGIAVIAHSIEDVYRVLDPLIGVPMLAAPLTRFERVPEYEDTVPCGDCGVAMDAVRPGKYQCPNEPHKARGAKT